MAAVVGTEPLVELDYAAAVDATSLVEHETVVDPARARLLVAARVGPVRLIDNCAALNTAHDAEAVPPAHPRVSAEVRQLERIA